VQHDRLQTTAMSTRLLGTSNALARCGNCSMYTLAGYVWIYYSCFLYSSCTL